MSVEPLEARRLLSAFMANGNLIVIGTSGADLVTISVVGKSFAVDLNGDVSTFKRAGVNMIRAQLLGGNDTFTAAATIGKRMDVDAGAGVDSVVTGHGDDKLRSGGGIDTMRGGDGNDQFITVPGYTRLYGGNGDDSLVGKGADLFYGGSGTDSVDYSGYESGVHVTLDLTANDGEEGEGDNIAPDVERIIATAYADSIMGGGGELSVEGGEGDDTLVGAAGNSYLDGGAGDDLLIGRLGNDTLLGGDGNDMLDGGTGSDEIRGGAGSDTVTYASRREGLVLRISGYAESGAEGENDLIDTDIEVLRGGAGNDLMVGGDGPETFYAGAGDDTIDGGWGDDTIWGGDGIDTADYSSRSTLQQLRINEGSGIPGEKDIPHDDIEVLIGGSGDDWIQGGYANNLLIGGAGGDTLIGMGGDDTLIGGEGPDVFGYDPGGGPASSDAAPGNDVIYAFDMTGNSDGAIDQIRDTIGTNELHYSLTDPDQVLA